MRRKSEPLSAVLVLASRVCAWIVRAWPQRALNYTVVLPGSLLRNLHLEFVPIFSAWGQDNNYAVIFRHRFTRWVASRAVYEGEGKKKSANINDKFLG